MLNFRPKLNREFLQSGYRDLMKRLYEPKAYYQRIRTFLKHHRPARPAPAPVAGGFAGVPEVVLAAGRLASRAGSAYWRLFWSTLLRRPRQFPHAIELAIMGYHFRRVARTLAEGR